jgi:hypothetical protein
MNLSGDSNHADKQQVLLFRLERFERETGVEMVYGDRRGSVLATARTGELTRTDKAVLRGLAADIPGMELGEVSTTDSRVHSHTTYWFVKNPASKGIVSP